MEKFEQQITSVVATSHHKWPYENLYKEISFAFSTREGRKALAKRIYWSERGWQGRRGEMTAYILSSSIAGTKPLAIKIKSVSLTRYKGVKGICRRASGYMR